MVERGASGRGDPQPIAVTCGHCPIEAGASVDCVPGCDAILGRLWAAASEGEEWATYFEARADKSMANARRQEPDTVKVKAWLDVAAGERACAMILRSGLSPAEAIAELGRGDPQKEEA